MKCPICELDLVMTDRQGVEIDYCPKCRGVWLDRGELDKIIEKSAPEARSENNPARDQQPQFRRDDDHRNDYKKHDNHGGYYGGHKKKSILGEIFDF